MDKNERVIYTADVNNSMLELVEEDFDFDAPSVLSDEIGMRHLNATIFPKRNFWELAKKYLD